MNYDFANLSHSDFEDLARDLIGAELNLRFEAFAEGPDGGMDGRHATATGSIILQAKHYHGSRFSTLKTKMKTARPTIDQLEARRYILVTSNPLTPANKAKLADVIGPSLKSSGDIFGPGDLNSLLRKHPKILTAHNKLWLGSTTVLEQVVTGAVEKAFGKREVVPDVLARLMPPVGNPPTSGLATKDAVRDVIFLIKSSPSDDTFALWLSPKLEAEGYRVFTDILTLQPGDRWRREINEALQYRAAKVLLFSRNATFDDPHVKDDLDIALDVAKELKDDRFVIPLRLEEGRKIKGIGDAVPVDFVRGWGEGLNLLLEALRRQNVPRPNLAKDIDPNWEIFRRRNAVPLVNEAERLTSNWLRVVEAPDHIRLYEATGVIQQRALKHAINVFPFPATILGLGILTFADPHEIDAAFSEVGRFELKYEIPLLEFVDEGIRELKLARQDASNLLVAILKSAWASFCRKRGLLEYQYSSTLGFHASAKLAPTRQLFRWGKQGERRSSMLRNVAKGHIWQFGVTAIPSFRPFWHFKLKSRVLFAEDNGTPEGLSFEDHKKMHRLRRKVCKGWRNKVWYGRMLAFLELLSEETAYIRLPLSERFAFVLDASPILFSSPVSTELPDRLDADEEESDPSTLGRPDSDEDDGE
jgi:hypothetical protein